MLIVQSIPVTARAPWLEARRTRINASEVGTLYGKGKQTTRLQLAYAKLYGEPDKRRDAGVLRRGILLEPACAMAVEHDHGIALSKVRHYLAGHDTDDQRVRVGATLDYDFEMDGARLLDALHRGRIANQWDDLDGLPVRMAVECKSIDRDIFETEWADGPPAQHIYQAMTQAMLGGYDGALIAGLVVNYNHDLYLYAVPRDEKLERKILADIGDFWGDLDAGVMPAAEPRDNSTIARHTKPKPGSLLDLRGDPSWELLMEDREGLKARVKGLEYEIDAIEVRIKEAMGDHTIALVDGWKVTWNANTKGVRSLRVERQ